MISYVEKGESVLVVRGINPSQAGYYWHDPGEPRWLGTGMTALRDQPILDPRSLRALLDGIDPSTGEVLAPRRPHRRAGWDLIFAAPKSVSLVAALAPAADADAVVGAHAAAVEGAVAFLEQRAAWAQRGRRGSDRGEVDGVVAAAFTHTASDAGDPHLHAHVVVANLAPAPDGRWTALADDALWPAQQAIGAVYQLGLRYHLGRLGLAFSWTGLSGGAANISGVPDQAIRAASRRQRAIVADRGSQELSAAARQVAAHRIAGGRETDREWRPRAAAAGFGPVEAAALTAEARQRALLPRRESGPDARAVEAWLAERSSTFGPLRVVVAVAATTPAGMHATGVATWADHFCAAAIQAPGRRVTSERAVTEDRAVLHVLRTRTGQGLAAAAVETVPVAHPGVAALACAGRGIEVLRAPPTRDGPLVAQAAIIDAARAAWQASGYRVAILSPSARAAARWQALTGLNAWKPGPYPPDVLIIDRADRMTSRQLAEVAGVARRGAAKLVLVEGGSLSPAHHPTSMVFAALAAEAPALDLVVDGPRATRSVGMLTSATQLHGAIEAAVERWAAERAAGRQPILVGLGPAEAGALNASARARVGRSGQLDGPVLEAHGRAYQAGDRVLALRQGAGRAGAVGTVREVDPGRRTMTIGWDGGPPAVVDRFAARRIAHGYATTPGYLGRIPGPVIALGDTRLLGAQKARVVEAVVIAPALRRTRDVELHRTPARGFEL